MDYKEKYENLVEAVKKLQEVNPSDEGVQNWINDNVPELKGNEDRKIKKALIEHFAGAHSSMYPYKGFTKEQILAWIEKQRQQDKVEPKFHKGEWIIFNGLTLYIGEDKSFYGTTTKDGINNSYDWDIDNVARLWTIKDAKDGDILYAKICDEEWLYLYNNLIDDPDFLGLLEKSWINNYCCYRQNDGWFSYEKQEAYPVNEYSIISPATKEQRDALMKAMADAGYTFDFEKKELRKIEQKPTIIIPKFRVGDEIKTSNKESLTITKIDEKGYWSEDLFICNFDEECIWDLVEQKPAWSEEDEEMIDSIIGNIKYLYSIGSCDNATVDMKVNWLKSISPNTHWKPTEEQMKSLAWVVEHGNTCQTAKLKEILEQLKAL